MQLSCQFIVIIFFVCLVHLFSLYWRKPIYLKLSSCLVGNESLSKHNPVSFTNLFTLFYESLFAAKILISNDVYYNDPTWKFLQFPFARR